MDTLETAALDNEETGEDEDEEEVATAKAESNLDMGAKRGNSQKSRGHELTTRAVSTASPI